MVLSLLVSSVILVEIEVLILCFIVEVFRIILGVCLELIGGEGNVNIVVCGLLVVLGGVKFL